MYQEVTVLYGYPLPNCISSYDDYRRLMWLDLDDMSEIELKAEHDALMHVYSLIRYQEGKQPGLYSPDGRPIPVRVWAASRAAEIERRLRKPKGTNYASRR